VLRRIAHFTLIELLVVIAVIAILAALLLPSLRGAQATAKATVCQSQLHQISVALEIYRGDHGDRFPFGWWQGSVTWPYGHAFYATWDWVLLPYLADRRVFRCPADTLLFERTYSYNAASSERVRGPWRFAAPWCNDSCAPPCWSRNPADGTPAGYGLDTFTGAAVERPAQTVIIRELNSRWVYNYAVPGGVASWKLGQIGYWWHSIHHYTQDPCDNHPGASANYLMVDAHVERKFATELPGGNVARTGWWYYRKKF